MREKAAIKHIGSRVTLLAVAATAVLALGAATAPAATFSNAGAITINDHDAASPYPSTIAATGLAGAITDVNLTLNDYSHTWTDDVGALLVGPDGQALLIMDGIGDANTGTTASAIDLTFDDAATDFGPTTGATLSSATYKPTANYTGDPFASPGPGLDYALPGPLDGNTATLASVFNGLGANSDWKLFVRDFGTPDSGSIAAGWSVDIATDPSKLAAPSFFASTVPASGADDNAPRLLGTSEGETVEVYETSDCSGPPSGSGPAGDFPTAGISVTVPDNSTTAFYAKATTAAPGVAASDCSASTATYTEVTPPPTPPTPNISQTPPPATKKKKCKRKRHQAVAAKKKCKRKRRK